MFKYVNKRSEKIDGLALATGQEKYTDDFSASAACAAPPNSST